MTVSIDSLMWVFASWLTVFNSWLWVLDSWEWVYDFCCIKKAVNVTKISVSVLIALERNFTFYAMLKFATVQGTKADPIKCSTLKSSGVIQTCMKDSG